MAGSATLYVWTTPAWFNGNILDHTWVTTYDNRTSAYADIAAVKAAGRWYWYCWGEFHANGGVPGNPTGFLGEKAARLSVAKCLVLPNKATSSANPGSQGTILNYGLHGVCHQLANQVLYATTGTKMTVAHARGYWISNLFYGTYGTEATAWAAKIQHCAGATAASAQGILRMEDFPDEFERHAREVLKDEPEVLARLLTLTGEIRAYVRQYVPGFYPPDAATINARNQHLLDQVAILLGPQRYERVFGMPPSERGDLVDPDIARSPKQMR